LWGLLGMLELKESGEVYYMILGNVFLFSQHSILGCIKEKPLINFEKDDFLNLQRGHPTMSRCFHNQKYIILNFLLTFFVLKIGEI
jgi:hypothetical protein